RVGQDAEIGAAHGRFQESGGGAVAAAIADIMAVIADAVATDGVEVISGGKPHAPPGRDQAVAQGIGKIATGRHMDGTAFVTRAVAAPEPRRAIVLDAAESTGHGRRAPFGTGMARPFLVILGLAAAPDHAVD